MYQTTLSLLILAFLVCGCRTSPVMRIGVISDTQSYSSPESRGPSEMRASLRELKKQGIDVLIYAGDIADRGDQLVYRDYLQVMREVFGDQQPETILIMGNHDYWNDLSAADAQKNFTENIGVPSINVHKVVNGYDFIGISPEDGYVHGTYTDEISGAFLREAMVEASVRRPGKPVFVITHHPARNTVYGSDDWGNDALYTMLQPYPGAVHFSGHTHYSLEDERAIHQRDFSSVGTSSLCYCELEAGKVNGTVPPEGGEVQRMLVVDVFPDRLEIRRYPSGSGCELKPDARWELPLPLAKDNFTYTDERASLSPAPEFPAGARAQMTFPAVPFDEAVLTADAAVHPDFVHSYALKLSIKGRSETERELLFFSDFYLGVDRMADPFTLKIPAEYLEGNAEYQAELIPIESFGKRGNGIQFQFVTPERAPVEEDKKQTGYALDGSATIACVS